MIHSQFFRHVATLMSGSVFAQVIALATVPIIARLFDPADFGIAAVFISVITILAGVAPLRYYRAAMIEKDDDRAHLLLVLSTRCLFASCLIILIIASVFNIVGIELPFGGSLNLWIWFVPVGVLFIGMGQIIAASLMRKNKFRPVALSEFGNAFLTAGSRILFGLFGSSVMGLIVGFLIGAIGKLVIVKVGAVKLIKKNKSRADWSELKALAIEYKDFPLYNMPTALLGSLSRNLPILLMGFLFEPVIIGFYAMADRLIRRPLTVSGKPIRDVFVIKCANAANNSNNLKKLFIKLTLGLFVLGAIPFGVLGLFGEQLMDLLLGERWVGAGSYLEILAPWYFSTWVIIGVQPIMVVIRRQALWLKVQTWMLVIRSAVFGFAYLAVADDRSTLIWFSAVNVCISIGVLCLTFYVITHVQSVDDKHA